MTFARDGSFVVDVSNDPSWLKLRLEPFERQAGATFSDRIVLFVDGREIRPTSVEYLAPAPLILSASKDARAPELATYRMRGRMPLDAHTLRWYYGLVIDPYPLTIRRADGRLVVEEVAGNAWSRTIDVSGQFRQPILSERLAMMFVFGLLLLPIAVRVGKYFTTKDTKDTKDQPCTT